jgi:hypothetical protein
LIGQTSGQYVTPAGQTTVLKLQILNSARQDIYLLQGDAYLDPNLNGTWVLTHSESLGSFHLSYLQSAVWTFGLTVPTKIQAANATNGMPQAVLLLKITYATAASSPHEQQSEYTLGVPGATVQEVNNQIWLAFGGLAFLLCLVAVYGVSKRRRRA